MLIAKKLRIILALGLLWGGLIFLYFTGSSDLNSSETTDMQRLKEYENDSIKRIFLLKAHRSHLKLIQEIHNYGYQSEIVIVLTINLKQHTIESVQIAEHDETLSYARHISSDWFQNRFRDKTVEDKLELVKMSAKKPNQIVAVTGATISSQAVLRGVNLGLENYKKIRSDLL